MDEGGGEICSTVCSPSQAMCMQGKHHGVFQGPSFLSHTLWASTLRVLIFFNSSSLFLSFCLTILHHTVPRFLGLNSGVIYSSWSDQHCVCVCFKGRVPQPSSVLARVQSASCHNQYQICHIPDLLQSTKCRNALQIIFYMLALALAKYP